MAANVFLLLASFLAVLLVLAQPLGRLMTGLVLDRALPGVAAFEQGIWRVCGVSDSEMNWRQYLCAILLFNALGLCFLVVLLMAQGSLPYNPQQLPGLSWHLALNTAISFVSNTNWQSYAGESTLSYFSHCGTEFLICCYRDRGAVWSGGDSAARPFHARIAACAASQCPSPANVEYHSPGEQHAGYGTY